MAGIWFGFVPHEDGTLVPKHIRDNAYNIDIQLILYGPG
jgi:hypothetical protein